MDAEPLPKISILIRIRIFFSSVRVGEKIWIRTAHHNHLDQTIKISNQNSAKNCQAIDLFHIKGETVYHQSLVCMHILLFCIKADKPKLELMFIYKRE